MIHKSLVIHPTANLALFGIYLHLALSRIAVDNQPRIVLLGVREAEMNASVSGRKFGTDTVVELYAIVMWLGSLVVVRELCPTFLGVHLQRSNLGEEGINRIIAYPRGALVRLAKAPNLVGHIQVFEPVAVLSRLRCPHVLRKRHGSSRECVSVRKSKVRIGSLQGVHVSYRVEIPCFLLGKNRKRSTGDC